MYLQVKWYDEQDSLQNITEKICMGVDDGMLIIMEAGQKAHGMAYRVREGVKMYIMPVTKILFFVL